MKIQEAQAFELQRSLSGMRQQLEKAQTENGAMTTAVKTLSQRVEAEEASNKVVSAQVMRV
jgi:regulator of replication initiation timing